jgi:hypothetical protein
MNECFSATWPGYDNQNCLLSTIKQSSPVPDPCFFSAVRTGMILAASAIQKSKSQLKLNKQSCICCLKETANNSFSGKSNHINTFLRTEW